MVTTEHAAQARIPTETCALCEATFVPLGGENLCEACRATPDCFYCAERKETDGRVLAHPAHDGLVHFACNLCAGAEWHIVAFSTGRAYGGPEEGGWWYDVGEPIESTPVWMHSEHPELIRQRIERYFLEEQHVDPRELLVQFVLGEPRPFPERVPHYE